MKVPAIFFSLKKSLTWNCPYLYILSLSLIFMQITDVIRLHKWFALCSETNDRYNKFVKWWVNEVVEYDSKNQPYHSIIDILLPAFPITFFFIMPSILQLGADANNNCPIE